MTFDRIERISLPQEEQAFRDERIRALEAVVKRLQDENDALKIRIRETPHLRLAHRGNGG